MSQESHPNLYQELRQLALSEGKKVDTKQACTIVVDLPLRAGHIVTFALRRKGECSIYFSSGGGYIGLDSCSGVKQMIKGVFRFFDIYETKYLEGSTYQTPAECASPAPDSLDLEFYFVNRNGIRHASASRTSEDPLAEVPKEDPLFPMFQYLNSILTAVRMEEEMGT